MDIELIDFGDRDDEFLNPEIKQQALSFAIITTVIGFVLSYWLFLDRKAGPAAQILDRKAAEGRTVVQRTSPGDRSADYGGGFRPPRVQSYKKDKKKRERPVWKDLKVATVLSKDSRSTRKEKSKVLAETSLGVVPDYKRLPNRVAASQRKSQVRRPAKVRSEDLSRLLFPIVENRPPKRSLAEIEQAVRQNIFILEGPRGEAHVGVVLSESGQALVSTDSASPGLLNRIWCHGRWRQADLVAKDDEFGIALIQVKGGGFTNLGLAPVPPSVGERLVTFKPSGRKTTVQPCKAGLAFGRAGFFVEGDFPLGLDGSPLFNERGELVGCQIYRLPGGPGTGFNLATNSASVYRLARGFRGGMGALDATKTDAVIRLSGYLEANLSNGEVKRGRVLPGTSLSDLHLGMTESEAKKWVSAPEKRDFGSDFTLWKSPAPPVTLYFVRGRLALLSTNHTGFATPEGLCVGAEPQVRKLLKDYTGLEVYSDLIAVPGLEIYRDSGDKVKEFVVKPRLSGS